MKKINLIIAIVVILLYGYMYISDYMEHIKSNSERPIILEKNQ